MSQRRTPRKPKPKAPPPWWVQTFAPLVVAECVRIIGALALEALRTPQLVDPTPFLWLA